MIIIIIPMKHIESEDEHTNNEPSNDKVIIKKKRKH